MSSPLVPQASLRQDVDFSHISNVSDSIPPTNPNNDAKVFWSVNAFILFLIFLTVIWCVFVQKYLYNGTDPRHASDQFYRTRLQRRREATKVTESPEKRRQQLLSSFSRHGVEMTVRKEDLVDQNPMDESVFDSRSKEIASGTKQKKVDTGDLELADNCLTDIESGRHNHSFSSLEEDTGQLKLASGKLVPNCCAVCLSGYDEGDAVVWSSNPKCLHAFHRDCVVDWLVKMQPETPCPCCRQEFTDLEQIRKEHNIHWLGNVAFDFNAVRFW